MYRTACSSLNRDEKSSDFSDFSDFFYFFKIWFFYFDFSQGLWNTFSKHLRSFETQKFSRALPLDPTGGLTAPPDPQLFGHSLHSASDLNASLRSALFSDFFFENPNSCLIKAEIRNSHLPGYPSTYKLCFNHWIWGFAHTLLRTPTPILWSF